MRTKKIKSLIVGKIVLSKQINISEISALLESQTELNDISVLSWNEFTYAPKVKFRIAHHKNNILLKYYVTEDNILAEQTAINSSVSKDSCVEFFFDPLGDGNYYNLEFNCIGTIRLSYGAGRSKREFVEPEIVAKYIKTVSTLGNLPFSEKKGGYTWDLTIIIPAEVMTFNEGITFNGLRSKGNFYKCGDDTSKKHYLSWNPIVSEVPDYHRPSDFGYLNFE